MVKYSRGHGAWYLAPLTLLLLCIAILAPFSANADCVSGSDQKIILSTNELFLQKDRYIALIYNKKTCHNNINNPQDNIFPGPAYIDIYLEDQKDKKIVFTTALGGSTGRIEVIESIDFNGIDVVSKVTGSSGDGFFHKILRKINNDFYQVGTDFFHSNIGGIFIGYYKKTNNFEVILWDPDFDTGKSHYGLHKYIVKKYKVDNDQIVDLGSIETINYFPSSPYSIINDIGVPYYGVIKQSPFPILFSQEREQQ